MKILHYSLGLPPYRTGGLTKYSIDLMKEEAEQGNEVNLLYPGKTRLLSRKTSIKNNKKFNNIYVFELINSLPVPLLYGITDVEQYTKKVDINVFIEFLEKNQFECIHIHTLMGLPREFLEAANKLKIKIIYTSHDYFGLCPKASLYNTDNKICNGYNEKCALCSQNAISYRKNLVLQSHIYKKMKSLKIISKLRNKIKNNMNSNVIENKYSKNIDYKKLKEYYYSMFEKVNIFHFNSEIAYETFKQFIEIRNYKIISITHSNIEDKRKMVEQNIIKNSLVLGYLGGPTIEKGFFYLIETMDKFKNDKFKLSIFFTPNMIKDYFIINKKYEYNQLQNVLQKLDVVIVPSLWRETFGFVVLEALAHDVPVIVSNNVGAKDLIKNGETGFVYNNEQELIDILESLTKNKVINLRENILDDDSLIFNMHEHTKEIIKLYQGEKI